MSSSKNTIISRVRDICQMVSCLARVRNQGPEPNQPTDSGKSSTRESTGYSMVAVTAFSLVASTWLLMTANIVYPAYQKAAEYRYYSSVRSAAEAGLDYVVGQLNTAQSGGTTSSFDDTSSDGVPRVSSVPSSVIGNSSATVTVSVNNVAPAATSSIYASNLDPVHNAQITSNLWRVVESTSTYAGLRVTVRVVVRPIYTYTTTSTTTTTGGGTSPYFEYALFSQNALSASGNMTTNAYDSRLGAYGGSNINNYRGNVGSNTSITIGGNTNIGGSVVVLSSPKGSTTAVVATRSANAVVQNMVKVNGITSGFTATNGPTPAGTDHVKALEYGTPRAGDYTTPIDKSLTVDPITLNTAPSSPSGSYDVGAISISGNGVVIVKNGAAPVTSINVSANNTLYIPPGNYKASSISISGNGQMQIQSSVTTSTVVFLEGNTAGANVAQLGGNGVANNTNIPAKFQIMTNSSKNVQIAGNGNFYGVIYAPSAPFTNAGNGTMYGAVVAKSISSTGNSTTHFDLALADPTYAGQNGLGLVLPGTTSTTTSTSTVINGLQTVSWEEQ